MKAKNTIHLEVLMALAVMFGSGAAQAACVDNGGMTYTCTGTSENNNAYIEGSITLDSSGAPATFTNITTDPAVETGPGLPGYVFDPVTGDFLFDEFGNFVMDVSAGEADYGAVIRNDYDSITLGPTSTIAASGSNPVVINNIGGRIEMLDKNTYDFFVSSNRSFDPSGWSNDADGKLLNNGVIVGMAAAISAGPEVSSLTVNNLSVNDGIIYPTLNNSLGIPSRIFAEGELTAAIFANTPVLNINNTGSINKIHSFAGATYTPPVLQDGTQYATVTSAGVTNVNMNGGDIFELRVEDRNPLLTRIQSENPGLALAYDTADVGPRNSVINVNDGTIFNLYLGSGAHVLNIGETFSGQPVRNIVVDQSDSEVVEVTGGVANTLYKVHGDRTFTLNSINQYGPGNITIHDVAGSVNTLSFLGNNGNIFGTIAADGLGTNTLNMACVGQASNSPTTPACVYQTSVTGMTTINFSGDRLVSLAQNMAASGDINLQSGGYLLARSLTATNVVVGSDSLLSVFHKSQPSLDINLTMGDINANLINDGRVDLGDAVLDVSGNVTMNAGSTMTVGVGPQRAGYLNNIGTANFSSDSIVSSYLMNNTILIRDGQSHVIANNINGMPTMVNSDSFIQWTLSESSGDLLMTADVGVSGALEGQVTEAARNATNAFFAYQGNEAQAIRLLMELQTLRGEDNLVNVAERLHPEINDGAIRMVLSNTDKLFGAIGTRLLDSYLPASLGESGVNTGSDATSLSPGGGSFWVHGFGDRGRQETMDGVDGYGTSSVGMAAGSDRTLDGAGNTRAGFAFGYARGNITNSGHTVNNRIDTNSFMGAVYASKNWENWYLNAALGYGRHTYDTRRQLLDHTATGSHYSSQFSAHLSAGMPLLFGDSLAVIPMASLDASHVRESGYKEKGKTSVFDQSVNGVPTFTLLDSPINLEVDARHVESFRTGLGGKLVYTLQQPDWAAELELRGMFSHEFGDIAQDTTARFVVGGQGFKSPGLKPARDGIQVGGTIRLTGAEDNDQVTLLTSYDADIRDEYFGQTVSLNLRWDFDQATRYVRRAAERQAVLLARKAPEQLVGATEEDIAALSAAMQATNPEFSDNPEARQQLAVDLTITNWVNAQSSKNMDVYFNSYAANFVTPDGSSRQQWERKRRAEFKRAPNEAIKVSYLTVKPNGDKATAVFTQTLGKEVVQKIVDLQQRGDRWLIVREDSIALTQ